MKKWILRGFAVVLAVGLCTASVYAAGGHHGFRLTCEGCSVQPHAPQSCRYSDTDGDGLCDFCGLAAGVGHACRGDADGDGLCDLCGLAACSGHACRGDGICQVCGQTAGSCTCGGHHQRTQLFSTGGGHHGRCAGGGC